MRILTSINKFNDKITFLLFLDRFLYCLLPFLGSYVRTQAMFHNVCLDFRTLLSHHWPLGFYLIAFFEEKCPLEI